MHANKHSYKPVPFIHFFGVYVLFYYYYSYTALWSDLKVNVFKRFDCLVDDHRFLASTWSNNGWIMSFQRAQTWEAVTYNSLNDDRHMTWCTAYPHTHKNTFVQTHSQHLHQTICFHCNPLCVPHCLKRKRLKLSTCSSVEVFLSERSAVTWLCFVSLVSIPSHVFSVVPLLKFSHHFFSLSPSV